MRFSRIKNFSDCSLVPLRTEDFKFQKSVKIIIKNRTEFDHMTFIMEMRVVIPTQKKKVILNMTDLTDSFEISDSK